MGDVRVEIDPEGETGITPDAYMRLECARMVADRSALPNYNAERAQELYDFVVGGKS